jgi:hypothetical protein
MARSKLENCCSFILDGTAMRSSGLSGVGITSALRLRGRAMSYPVGADSIDLAHEVGDYVVDALLLSTSRHALARLLNGSRARQDSGLLAFNVLAFQH